MKEAAVQQICQAIECGELKAGEILNELGLACKLGVAQPTIREAFLELEFIGYVERTATRKARVTLLTRGKDEKEKAAGNKRLRTQTSSRRKIGSVHEGGHQANSQPDRGSYPFFPSRPTKLPTQP